MNINASGRSALIVAAGIWIWCSGPLQAQEATAAQAAPVAAQPQQQLSPLQQLFGVKPAAPVAAEQPAPAEVGKPVALNKYTRHRSRKRQVSSRSRKHERVAKTAKASTAKASDREENSKTADASNSTVPAKTKDVAALSASVANAKAQLVDPNSTSGAVATMTPVQNTPTPPQSDAFAAAPPVAAAGASPVEASVVPSDELNEVDRALSEKTEPTPTLALASINAPTTGQAVTAGDDGSTWAKASLIGKIFIAFGGLLTLASAARMLIA